MKKVIYKSNKSFKKEVEYLQLEIGFNRQYFESFSYTKKKWFWGIGQSNMITKRMCVA